MPDPVLVHNNIAVYNTFRNDCLNDPRENWFTTDPWASEQDDPHSFDVRDYGDITQAANADSIKDKIIAILEHPDVMPMAKWETLDEICFSEEGFFKTTPEQDKAFELAARIDAHMQNYFPSLVSMNVTLPSGLKQGVYVIPQEPSGHLKLHIYDHKLSPNDYATLMQEKPVRIIEHNGGSLSRTCCLALGVEVPEQLQRPLVAQLEDAQQRANQPSTNTVQPELHR